MTEGTDRVRNIRMIIEYDGSRYLGWQRQKSPKDMTIQGKLENVVSLMVDAPTEVTGSGRTDAGVHAYAQVANFKAQTNLSVDDMIAYLNHYLPSDIVVKQLDEVPLRFHARYNALGKKYVYRIWNDPIPSAFQRKYSWYIPNSLDIPAMIRASRSLVGTHDFLAFSSVKKSKKSTVRTIQSVDFSRKESMLEVSFVGNGFLHNMVRIMVGSLVEVGTGRKDEGYIDRIFEAGWRREAGPIAPPEGLFLVEVYYPEQGIEGQRTGRHERGNINE